MKARKLITAGLLAALGLGLAAGNAHALRNLALRQQGELPRDIYVDLVHPDRYFLDRLVVQFVEDTRIRLRDGSLVSLEGRSTSGIADFLKAHPNITVERLFVSMTEEELDAYVDRGERLSGWDVADLNNFYLFRVDGNREAKGLLQELLKDDLVQTCYYEPVGQPATCGSDPAPVTPSYVASQDYREAAPTGVDIQYAWNHDPTYGNGVSTYWFQDLEWGWCEAHEDYSSTFLIRNPPDSGVADYYNHGTAVVSIVGACDDGKGVTGLVPDCRMTARVVSNHASYADALIAIGGDLLTGETYLIEIHHPGPSQGTVCPCNCGQFEYIAIEYWAANFNAILANSTNGKFCIEAAGNGSMDLDWPGYGGAFDLGVRDSQAIIVGAADGGAAHDPECFTNHGTRISAYGWGSGVYAAGYGDLFNQASCEQDYTDTFSGTSSASPIVGGAAVSLALIHVNQEGSYPSPITLRSRLTTNGTPQNSDFTREISVLPNMKGILAPDLEKYVLAGWADYIVPSDVAGTTTLPAALWPAPALTYLDWAFVNWSRYSEAAPARGRIYRDDVNVFTASYASLGRNTYGWAGDWSTTVRGGLHYLREECDPDGELDESREDNNRGVIGYRWEPVVLAANTPQVFTRGCKKNPLGYSSYAIDGYGNGGGWAGWWDVTAVMPATGADYDLYMFNTDPTPTTGWTTSVAYSGSVSFTDFVGCNNNTTSDGDWVGVLNYGDTSQDYTVEREASIGVGAAPAAPALMYGNVLSAGEILDVYEMHVPDLDPIYFTVDITGGNANLALYIFGPSATYFSRSGATWTLDAGGAGADESGIFTPTATGWHGIVVIKSVVTDLSQFANYSVYWGSPPAGDLVHTTLAGWTAPVVARNSGGSVGVLPAILNEGASLGDAGLVNVGLGTMTAGSNLAFYVDGPFVYSSGDFVALAPGATGTITGRAIGTVKGGRHELGSRLDYLSEVGEQLPGGEDNNGYYTQYVWAPYTLAANTPVSRSPAPNWRNFDNPDAWSQPGYNQDGYAFSSTYWTGVGVIPADATMMLNIQGYDYASTNPLTALLNPVSFDWSSNGRMALVMTNGNVVGSDTRNAGVHNNWGYPGTIPTGNYTVQVSPSLADLSVGHLVHGTLAAGAGTGGEIVHCYDIYLSAGQTYPLTLFNNSTVDLGVAVYSAGQDYVPKRLALAEFNVAGGGVDETGSFTATTTGWHGVAVFRNGTADLGPAAPYGIVIGAWAPAAITDLAITPVDFSAGLATVHITFTPVTTDVWGNLLTVDHYTIYTVQANGYDFSAPYVEALSSSFNDGEGLLYYGNIGWTTSAYLYLVAVDNDGLILATSSPLPWRWETEIPGFGAEPRLSVPPLGPDPSR